MKVEVCCIFNLAPHYRAPIYKLMDEELQCDFYFGDKVNTPIKQMEYQSLVGFKKILNNVNIGNTAYMWQKGAIGLIFKKYEKYIITGDVNVLSNWAILILAIILKKDVFAWTHGMRDGRSKKRTLFEKTFFRLCKKVLLYGNYSKDIMLKNGFKDEKLIPIYNSLDYAKQLLIRSTLKETKIFNDHFHNNLPNVIYIGRIQKSKKLNLLVEAIARLNNNKRVCNLIFIGKDIGDNDVVKKVNTLKLLDAVWFYGPCYDEKEIGNLIFNSTVCVSPGPVGLTALHSLTYGTPVISNNNFAYQMPEFETIKEGQTGTFFENDNLDSLTQTIHEWISISKEKREIIRKNCYEVIDANWNPNYQIQVLKSL